MEGPHKASGRTQTLQSLSSFPHPARGTLRPKRENSRMQVDQGGARRGSAEKHPGLPVAGHSLALAQESCILRDLHLPLPIPTHQGGGGGSKEALIGL